MIIKRQFCFLKNFSLQRSLQVEDYEYDQELLNSSPEIDETRNREFSVRKKHLKDDETINLKSKCSLIFSNFENSK